MVVVSSSAEGSESQRRGTKGRHWWVPRALKTSRGPEQMRRRARGTTDWGMGGAERRRWWQGEWWSCHYQ